MSGLQKWVRQHRWMGCVSLGLLSLSAVLVLAQSQLPAPTPTPIASIAAPTRTPFPTPQSPLPTPPAPLLTPTPQAAQPTPKPSATVPVQKPGGKPQLTPAEQELNRRAKEAFLASAGTVDSVIEMQVAVVDGAAAVSFITSEPAALIDSQGKVVGQLEANAGYTARLDGGAIAIGDSQFSSGLQIEPGVNGRTQIGDLTYRGRMVLVVHKGSIWAVNHVNLRKYLHSVVASEVSPSWQANALRAQAIAARSYALTYYFRPVSNFYHLGDDEYYQVYSGIAREAPETNQAVDATAGEYVSYKGGIVESLYAASDDIVAEAFQGHGMSQLGASDLANQGYKYEQILGHYYPGTAVGRIVLDHE